MNLTGVDLYPGERLLWTGAPTRFPFFNRADLFLIPWSVLSCGGLTLTLIIGLPKGKPAAFSLVVVALSCLFAVQSLIGRFVARRLSLRGTRYALTDRRLVITAKALGRKREHSTYLRDLAPPVLSAPDDMVGTIGFGATNVLGEAMLEAMQAMTFGPIVMPVLVEVQHPRWVRDIIASAQAAPGTATAP